MKTKSTNQPIHQIYRKRNRIELSPFFQRESVWKKPRKQLFIDTLIKGWGIPKIYLLVEKSGDKNNYYCIDGKQRLLSIFEFMDGKYSTDDKYNPNIGEKTYLDLPEEIQDKFDKYILPIEEITDAKSEEITELFKRLQLGLPLNSAEKLNSIGGYIKDEIKTLSNHSFFVNKIELSDTRYSHFVICTQIAFLEINGIMNMSLPALEKFLKENSDSTRIGLNITSKLKKIKIVLDHLDKIFPKKTDILKNRATVISFYLLVSKFADITNIKSKEDKFRIFFEKFSKELDKQIKLGSKPTDAEFIHYQGYVTQGADKQKAIKAREDVLLQKLPYYSKTLNNLLKPKISLEDEHSKVFIKYQNKLKTQLKINNWLINNIKSMPVIKCKNSRVGKSETLAVHIRNCQHYKSGHGTYTVQQIEKSIRILKDSLHLLPK